MTLARERRRSAARTDLQTAAALVLCVGGWSLIWAQALAIFDFISPSAWHVHRAVKGAAAVSVQEVVRWASANGARVLGFDDAGVIAPGKPADLAIFELSHPRYFGLHDPLLGPVVAAGSAHLRHLLVGGRVVVDAGAIPGLDLEQRHDAARAVARLA